MQIRDRIKELRRVRAGDLVPHPKNWRVHPESQKSALRGLLAEIGYADVLLTRELPDGRLQLIDGHPRRETTPDAMVPVLVTDLTEEEAEKVLVTLDPLAGMATADKDNLKALLASLEFESQDVSAMLEQMAQDCKIDPQVMNVEGLTDPDAIPEPPDEPITRPGDLWILGNHRLLCGDSSKPDDVDRLLDGAKIQLVNTDPPYGVFCEPRSNNAIAAGLSSFAGATHHQKLDVERIPGKSKPTHKKLRAKDRPLANDFLGDEEFGKLLQAWFGNIARVLLPGRAFYIWGGYANVGNYPPVLKAYELYFSQAIIWVKEHPVLTRKDFMGNHEWCQPADTKVATPDGLVPLGSLRDGDRVVSYSRNHNALIGLRQGIGVSALAVLDRANGEEVAALAGKIQPAVFAAHVDAVATWYCGADVLVERNNHGHAVLLWLRDNSRLALAEGLDGKDGWLSNAKGKAMLYDAAADAFRSQQTLLHSFASFTQLASIEGASLRAPEGEPDDRAVAYALALWLVQMSARRGTGGMVGIPYTPSCQSFFGEVPGGDWRAKMGQIAGKSAFFGGKVQWG